MVQFPKLADCRLSNVLEHPAGVEPARPTWQAGRRPLHHGCVPGLPFRARRRARNDKPYSRVGGTRTLTSSLKRRVRCRYATTLGNRYATFMAKQACHDCPSPLSSPGRNCTSHRRLIRPQCSSYNTGPASVGSRRKAVGRQAIERLLPSAYCFLPTGTSGSGGARVLVSGFSDRR